MKTLLHIALVAVLACGLTACGTKGKLKSPSQIKISEEKKARKKSKSPIASEKAAPVESPAESPDESPEPKADDSK